MRRATRALARICVSCWNNARLGVSCVVMTRTIYHLPLALILAARASRNDASRASIDASTSTYVSPPMSPQ